MTFTFLINQVLKSIGILPTGASLGTGSTQVIEGFDLVNNLLDNWSADPVMAPAALVGLYPLSTVQSYTIGTGQTFNLARPSKIVAAACVQLSGITTPVRVCTAGEWAGIEDRAAQSHQVTDLFYDRGLSVGHVYVSPIPLVSAQIELTTWAALTKFADYVTDNPLPPAYARMLEWATAAELYPQYPGARNIEYVMAMLADAKAAVRNLNESILGPDAPEGQTGPVAEK